MKTRKQKDDQIAVLQSDFQGSPHAILINYLGINVADDERLRRELREANLTYRVVKNTLAIRAAEGTGIATVKDGFKGGTAVALSSDVTVTLVKVL